MARPKTWNHPDVLEKAMRVFWERGYDGASLQALVAATGVNRFSLYKEFGGKEGLYHATLRAYIDDLDERFGAILRRQPLGLDNIRTFFAAVSQADFQPGCFALNTIREKHVAPPAAFALVEELAFAVEVGLRDNLRAARASGDVAETTDVDALARLLAALDMGLLTQSIVVADAGDRSRELAFLDRLLQ